jgi:hypothetical protein
VIPEPSNQARRALASARYVLCAAAVLMAMPAGAFVPPASSILKRTAQHRGELHLSSVEVRGTIAWSGPAAEQMRAAGVDPARPMPATFQMKVPGRCRLELAPDGTPPAQRPSISLRGGRVTGARGLQDVGAARALVESVCALLGEHGTPSEPERGIAQRLGERGVDLQQTSLARYQGRVAWVIGGKPQDGRAQVWIDKQSFDPVRFISPVSGAVRDVRFLAAGSASERFPQAIEVWSGGQQEARFTADVVTPNPKLPDTAFP